MDRLAAGCGASEPVLSNAESLRLNLMGLDSFLAFVREAFDAAFFACTWISLWSLARTFSTQTPANPPSTRTGSTLVKFRPAASRDRVGVENGDRVNKQAAR